MIITTAMITIDIIVVISIVIMVPTKSPGLRAKSPGLRVHARTVADGLGRITSYSQRFSETTPPQSFRVGILWE
jgi:hypothetical protein